MSTPEWDKRIARADELAKDYPSAAEVLTFYGRIADFQRKVYDQVVSHSVHLLGDLSSVRDRLDLNLAVQHLPTLFSLVERHGPAGLVHAANELHQQTPEQWLAILSAHVKGEGEGQGSDPARFFARACLQPYAECIAGNSGVQLRGYTGSICPLCNSRPLTAVLRPEGDGGKRSLVCSFCLLEWIFRRIVCPVCGEQNNDKLPRYSAPDFPHVRVEACDSCKKYLKSIDLTINGRAVPIVDEIATVPLDLWAGSNGYSKIALNMIGC